MQLGLGQRGQKRLDQHDTLALTEKRRRRRHDGLSPGNAHAPLETPRRLPNQPLQGAAVRQHLGDARKEDDGRDHADHKPRHARDGVVGEEGEPLVGKAKEVGRAVGDEAKNGIADFGAEDEERDEELEVEADQDRVPADLASVPRGQPEQPDRERQPGKTDPAVGGIVVVEIGLDKDDGGDEGDEDEPACEEGPFRREGPFGRDGAPWADDGPVPEFGQRRGQAARGEMPEDEPGHDGEPDEERDDPVLVDAVEDEASNPPSFGGGRGLLLS